MIKIIIPVKNNAADADMVLKSLLANTNIDDIEIILLTSEEIDVKNNFLNHPAENIIKLTNVYNGIDDVDLRLYKFFDTASTGNYLIIHTDVLIIDLDILNDLKKYASNFDGPFICGKIRSGGKAASNNNLIYSLNLSSHLLFMSFISLDENIDVKITKDKSFITPYGDLFPLKIIAYYLKNNWMVCGLPAFIENKIIHFNSTGRKSSESMPYLLEQQGLRKKQLRYSYFAVNGIKSYLNRINERFSLSRNVVFLGNYDEYLKADIVLPLHYTGNIYISSLEQTHDVFIKDNIYSVAMDSQSISGDNFYIVISNFPDIYVDLLITSGLRYIHDYVVRTPGWRIHHTEHNALFADDATLFFNNGFHSYRVKQYTDDFNDIYLSDKLFSSLISQFLLIRRGFFKRLFKSIIK